MTQMKDFRQAGRVKHAVLGVGTVASIHNGHMTVIYDDRNSSGENVRGIYDDLWFELNGSLLQRITRANGELGKVTDEKAER